MSDDRPSSPAPALPRWLCAPARRAWQALLLVLLALVAWLAFSPVPPAAADTGWDKANHLLAFATLAFAAEWACWRWPQRRWRVSAMLLLYGGCIEGVQTFIPNRAGEWPDLVADAMGVAIGLSLAAGVSTLHRLKVR